MIKKFKPLILNFRLFYWLAFFLSIGQLSLGQQKIDGIGQLRLGMRIEQIYDLLAIKKIKVVTNGDKDAERELYVGIKHHPVLLKADTTKSFLPSDWNISPCPDVQIMKVPEYKVAGIDISQLELTFYKNSLVKLVINAPSSEFIDAFKAKYGNGNLEVKTDTAKCSRRFGGDFEAEEHTYTTTWRSSDDSVSIYYIASDYRNSSCEQQYLTVFSIDNLTALRPMIICGKAMIERRQRHSKDALKDL